MPISIDGSTVLTATKRAMNENEICEELDQLARPQSLQEKLDEAVRPYRIGAGVIFHHRNVTYSASSSSVSPFSTATPVQVGCLAKTFTATLVARAVHEGRLRFEDDLEPLAEATGADPARRSRLRCATVYQLLNHTHGFDVPPSCVLRRCTDGFIDKRALVAALYPIANPGVVYNYSSVGSWLAAALLEQIYRKPYKRLVVADLLAPLGIFLPSDPSDAACCPAINLEIRLTAAQLLTFALLHVHGDSSSPRFSDVLRRLRDGYSVALPSWPPVGKKMGLGWLDYGRTFGQIVFGDSTSAAIRVFPAIGTVIVIVVEKRNLAAKVLSSLFGNVLGDRIHADGETLTLEQRKNLDLERYAGQFENAGFVLAVRAVNRRALRAQVFRKDSAGMPEEEPLVTRYLQVARRDTFVPIEPEPEIIPIVEFIEETPEGLFQFVRSGMQVFARSFAPEDTRLTNNLVCENQ